MASSSPKKGSFKDLVGGLLDVNIPCFGEEICYEPESGGFFRIPGVFDQAYFATDPDTEEVVSGNTLMVGIKLSNIPVTPEENDKVSILNRKFEVVDVQEDGQGGATIFLHEFVKDQR